ECFEEACAEIRVPMLHAQTAKAIRFGRAALKRPRKKYQRALPTLQARAWPICGRHICLSFQAVPRGRRALTHRARQAAQRQRWYCAHRAGRGTGPTRVGGNVKMQRKDRVVIRSCGLVTRSAPLATCCSANLCASAAHQLHHAMTRYRELILNAQPSIVIK